MQAQKVALMEVVRFCEYKGARVGLLLMVGCNNLVSGIKIVLKIVFKITLGGDESLNKNERAGVRSRELGDWMGFEWFGRWVNGGRSGRCKRWGYGGLCCWYGCRHIWCWCVLGFVVCLLSILLTGRNQGGHWYGTAIAKDSWCYCQVWGAHGCRP